MKIGDKIKYVGCSDEQKNWGGNDDPRGVLEEGLNYTVAEIEIHSWHTKVSLDGVNGKFNSACFDEVE